MTSAPFVLVPTRGVSSAYMLDPSKIRPLAVYPVEADALAYWEFGGNTAALATASLADIVAGQKLHRHIRLGSGVVGAAGTGYTSAPAVTLTPAGGKGSVSTTVAAGAVTGVRIDTVGFYDVAPTLALGGPGAGATGTVQLSDLPTIDTTSLTLLDTATSGLATEITEVGTGTEIAVVQWPADTSVSRVAVSTLLTGTSKGAAAIFTPAGLIARTSNISGDDTIARPSGVAAGDWVFLALVHDGTNRTLYVGGATPKVKAGVKDAYALSTYGLGNVAYSATGNGGIKAAAFSLLPPKSIADLDAIYVRIKNRMLARGIVVK